MSIYNTEVYIQMYIHYRNIYITERQFREEDGIIGRERCMQL
jgi:hypothetical protein